MPRTTLFQDRCHLPIVSLFLILVLFILKFCACSHFQLTSHQNWLCSNTDWSDYYVRMFLSSFCTTLIVCDRSWGGVCNLLTMLHIVWNVPKARKESGNVASAICWFYLIHCTVGVLSRESIFHNNFIQESWLTTFLSYSSISLTWICSSFVYEIQWICVMKPKEPQLWKFASPGSLGISKALVRYVSFVLLSCVILLNNFVAVSHSWFRLK